jgi:hypothetical protein
MKKILLWALLLCAQTVDAQQFMMQAWYWDYPKAGAGYSWADTIIEKSADMQNAGFTHVWVPPHVPGSFGENSNGYDPRDLYVGPTTSGLGTSSAVANMFGSFNPAVNFTAVADMIYNHRDGGYPEDNPAVEGWIENMTATKVSAGDQPFPSDRYRCVLPIGGTTGRGAGDYYIRLKSASEHPNYYNKPYKLYLQTNTVGWQNLTNLTESEPNAGGPCGEPFNNVTLGRDMFGSIDALGCRADEFRLVLNTSDFDAAGDTLFIFMNNRNVNGLGDYSDHFIAEVWYDPAGPTGGSSVQSSVRYQTYTNFANMPSGQGEMHWNNFRPNGNPTQLSGDLDAMYFFYDYDQSVPGTRDGLRNFTQFTMDNYGVGGLRMDAVKHFPANFTGELLNWLVAQGDIPNLVVGESFTTSVSTLSGWVNAVKASMNSAALAAIKPKVFDFSLRDNLRQVCDGGSDARNLFVGSCADNGMNGENVVTFVNNHDFRGTTGFDALVKTDIELAYAYILLNNKLGVPCVFYPDYYGYPPVGSGFDFNYHPTDKAPRKAEIDQMLEAHRLYVLNSNQHIYLNAYSTPYGSSYTSGSANRSAIFQLGKSGAPSCIVAINYGTTELNVTHSISNLGGTISNGTVFSDVLGRSLTPVATVNGSTQVNLRVPARSYSMWVQGVLPVIFPLELLEFAAKPQDRDVRLNWATANEQQVARFDIQRSTNGRQFETIGTVRAQNTPTARYEWLDERVPERAELVYYRLWQQDRDGQGAYSPVRTVRQPRAVIRVTASPVPATDRLFVDVEMRDPAAALLAIHNAQGRTLYEQRLDLESGTQRFEVPLTGIPAGTYTLRVVAGAWSDQQRIVVQ